MVADGRVTRVKCKVGEFRTSWPRKKWKIFRKRERNLEFGAVYTVPFYQKETLGGEVSRFGSGKGGPRVSIW